MKMKWITCLLFLAGIVKIVISEELPDYFLTQCDSGKFIFQIGAKVTNFFCGISFQKNLIQYILLM